ncbi:uncharacterized protein DS421_19g646490 [Arachis hypogaea]|uniref:Uncharacterized protein n=1 Tax=Arachis hypogaea TaxID=3818 RepID=A0A6B9V935_ARAHY|nr:uncharacterized protein DS421_19g646490 [Arachis hypogaea]
MKKEEKPMAKNGVMHTIAMLTIGMIICSANNESYNTIWESNNSLLADYKPMMRISLLKALRIFTICTSSNLVTFSI